MARPVRIGAGAAFANDRVPPAVDLAERGALDYLVLECLAERTLAQGQIELMRDPGKGFNPKLRRWLTPLLPLCKGKGTRIVTNMGSANPRAAGLEAAKLARELGLRVRIAVVEGDDVKALLGPDTPLDGVDATIGSFGSTMVSANAYIGLDGLMPALETGANLVITGRASDSSLFLAPAAHAHGWASDDWAMMAAGAMAGHLLECTSQVTGGYYADPGYKTVPGLADVGYPIGVVTQDGRTTIEKLPDTGGCVTIGTVKEQLLYEVHDPSRYYTPDVTADFTGVKVMQTGVDEVMVSSAVGGPRPQRLKVIVGFDAGSLAEAEISYAGPGAQDRAMLAREVLYERMVNRGGYRGALRLDIIGVNSIHATAVHRSAVTEDVRLRAALRTKVPAEAELLSEEMDSLYIAGPAGGGGVRARISPSIVTQSAFIDRDRVKLTVEVIDT